MRKTTSSIFSSEDLWSAVLSQKKDEINRVLKILDVDSYQDIKNHLEKMTSEDGWHPSQKSSASFALRIIEELETRGD
jgi:hypothetical protein